VALDIDTTLVVNKYAKEVTILNKKFFLLMSDISSIKIFLTPDSLDSIADKGEMNE
jgi:hypothetical protein